MKKFETPEITLQDLRTKDVMTGVLLISAERSNAKLIDINAGDAVEGYEYWQRWNDNN